MVAKERFIEGKEAPKAAGRASVFGGQPLLSCNMYARGGLAPYYHGTRLLGEPSHWEKRTTLQVFLRCTKSIVPLGLALAQRSQNKAGSNTFT